MTFRNLTLFEKYAIHAKDGKIGKVKDFLFDDITWTIRYLVVDAGNWLLNRQVLLAPVAVEETKWDTEELWVNLTKTQVENSPNIQADMPVSLQQQIDLHNYYAWPHYWTVMNFYPYVPSRMTNDVADSPKTKDDHAQKNDPHLRSANEVRGYHIQATDGKIGHVEDFLVDDEQWEIHYMVVDTRNWLPGRKVLVSPKWITTVTWEERKVSVFLTQDAVKRSPEYYPRIPVSQEYINQLHDHYGQPKPPEKIREELFYPPPTP